MSKKLVFPDITSAILGIEPTRVVKAKKKKKKASKKGTKASTSSSISVDQGVEES